jgi:transcriptional regulator with XRE-family HTH domain
MTLNEIVAEQIRTRREAKGWRKVDLLRNLCMGDHAAHVWQWESGSQLPGAYYLCALADVFGCSVDELLGRK